MADFPARGFAARTGEDRPMGLLLLLPATGLTIAAYIALYIAGKSEGGMRSFGKILGVWTLLIAAIIAVGGLTSPFFGGRPFGIAPRMHRQMGAAGMEGMRRGRMGPPQGAAAPAAGAPAAPPPSLPSET